VLVFQDEYKGYIAKVADFGFSTCFRGEHDLISMPKSVPWNAPEHHNREFWPQAAKKMDVYSFGILCLWLLFGAEPSPNMPLPSGFTQEEGFFISFEKPEQERNLLETWKRDSSDQLSEWASWLVKEHGYFDSSVKNSLAKFFESTLASNPTKRSIDFSGLFLLLTPAR